MVEDFRERTSFQLLCSARDDDEQALSELFHRYLPSFRRWARGRLPRYCRDLLNTDDLTQDVLYRAIRKADRFEYRHEGAFSAYLRRGLKNRILDELRRLKNLPDRDSMGDYSDQDRSPLERVIDSETIEEYETALERLRPKDQGVIIERLELGRSFVEIAVAYGFPSPDAARKATSRAVRRLALEMANAC